MGDNAVVDGLATIIGPIPHTMRETYCNPGETYQTGWDLTELLMNRIGPVVTQQISGLLRKSYISPYTSFLLPLRQLGPLESTAVRWMEIHFDSGLANQVETEGVARLYQHKKNKRGARAVRRGVACKVDSMFYATPEGRELWRKQILQLATIVQRTNEYDVLSTLLNCVKRDPTYHRNGEIGHGNNVYGISDSATFMEMLKQRIDWFGIVNKSPDSRGFSNMCTTLRTVMRRRGVDVDALIVPPHLLGYYFYTKPDLWEAQMTGPSVDSNREFAIELSNENTGLRQQKWQGLTLVDSYVQRMTDGHADGEDVSDLLTIQRQIGEFYPMCTKDWYDDGATFENFGSRTRNIKIFNEDHSRIVPVKYNDAVDNCKAWLDQTQNLDNGTAIVFKDALNPKVFEGNNDLKLTSADGVVTFGDLEFTNGRDAAVKELMAKSFASNYDKDDQNSLGVSFYTRSVDDQGNTKQVPDNEKERSEASNTLANQSFELLRRVLDQITGGTTYTVDGIKSTSRTNKDEVPGASKFTNLFMSEIFKVPVTRDVCKKMNEMGLYVPFDFILCRPFMQYACSSVIMMKSGTETGETLIGQQKFEMSSNVADRTLYANYFYYGKAVVRDEKNVVVAPDVFIQSYVKGNNTEFITSFEDIAGGGMNTANDTKSLLAFIVPAMECIQQEKTIIDITGQFMHMSDVSDHFSTAPFYKGLLSIDPSSVADPISNECDYEDCSVMLNTVCCLGHTEDHKGNVLYTNTGHLGCECYNNCNATRKPGVYSEIKSQTYNYKQC